MTKTYYSKIYDHLQSVNEFTTK